MVRPTENEFVALLEDAKRIQNQQDVDLVRLWRRLRPLFGSQTFGAAGPSSSSSSSASSGSRSSSAPPGYSTACCENVPSVLYVAMSVIDPDAGFDNYTPCRCLPLIYLVLYGGGGGYWSGSVLMSASLPPPDGSPDGRRGHRRFGCDVSGDGQDPVLNATDGGGSAPVLNVRFWCEDGEYFLDFPNTPQGVEVQASGERGRSAGIGSGDGHPICQAGVTTEERGSLGRVAEITRGHVCCGETAGVGRSRRIGFDAAFFTPALNLCCGGPRNQEFGNYHPWTQYGVVVYNHLCIEPSSGSPGSSGSSAASSPASSNTSSPTSSNTSSESSRTPSCCGPDFDYPEFVDCYIDGCYLQTFTLARVGPQKWIFDIEAGAPPGEPVAYPGLYLELVCRDGGEVGGGPPSGIPVFVLSGRLGPDGDTQFKTTLNVETSEFSCSPFVGVFGGVPAPPSLGCPGSDVQFTVSS
ncbi:MAG: hypothetical protein ACRC1K_22020 [Planctomycetia bacterium]